MKRRLFAIGAGAALAVTLAGAVSATHGGDVEKPLCADIVSGGGQLLADPSSGAGPYDLTFALQTADRCGGVLFTLYVFATEADCESGTGTPIATLTERGTTADQQVVFNASDVSTTGSVWVYATSSRGPNLFDEAPDDADGCLEVTDDPPAGGKFT